MPVKHKTKKNSTRDFYIDIISKNRLRIFVVLVLMALSSLAGTGMAYVYMKVIDCITAEPFSRIVLAVLLYLAVSILNSGFGVIVSFIAKKTSNQIDIGIKKRVFSMILKQDGEDIAQTDSAEYINILTTDATKTSELLGSVMFPAALSIIRIVTMTVFLLIIQWQILAVVALIQPLLIIVQKQMKQRMQTIAQKNRSATVSFIRTVKEYTANLFRIKMLGKNEMFQDNFSSKLEDMKRNELSAQLTSELSSSFLGLVNILPIIAIMLIGGYEITKGAATIGALVVYIQYYQGLFAPINDVMSVLLSIETYKPSIKRIISLLERENSMSGSLENGSYDSIRFKHVDFGYPEKKQLFHNLNLTLKKGESYGIFGESGCGKSTLCRLILGLWQCSGGEILIGGQNVKEINKDELYRNVTYLSQESFLFNESIYNNVVMGDALSDQEFDDVMKKVNLYDMVSQLPDGKDSIAGDNGVLLSGGQKKRIELARLLIHKSPILILDEPTTGLDDENAAEIMRIFMREFQNSLIIIISHQMEIVEMCGNIFDMKTRKWIRK